MTDERDERSQVLADRRRKLDALQRPRGDGPGGPGELEAAHDSEEEQVEEFRELYRERCDAMLDELDRQLAGTCSWSVPTGGFFVWLRLPEGLDSKQLLASALQARVAYVPGRGFYADGAGGRGILEVAQVI